jgi:hypothetical protein
VFWVISVYFNIWNTLPKFFTFLPGHPVCVYIYIYIYTYTHTLFLSLSIYIYMYRESVCVCVQNGTTSKTNQKDLIGLGETITDTHLMNRLVPSRSFSVVRYKATFHFISYIDDKTKITCVLQIYWQHFIYKMLSVIGCILCSKDSSFC